MLKTARKNGYVNTQNDIPSSTEAATTELHGIDVCIYYTCCKFQGGIVLHWKRRTRECVALAMSTFRA